MRRVRANALFAYYGSKSKIAGRYPAPRHRLIVEPFGGSAAYSVRYADDHDVWINELNPRVYAIWRYLLDTPMELVLRDVPRRVKCGAMVIGYIKRRPYHPGLLEMLRSSCNLGSWGGDRGTVAERVTWFAERTWHQVHQRLEINLPRVKHWRVTRGSYKQLPDVEATWFIDPPYSDAAGQVYANSRINYQQLADWCKGRRGQAIVCEHVGASWLPFKHAWKPLVRGGVSAGIEAIWSSSKSPDRTLRDAPEA